jgi:hypothetical protein
MGNKTGNRPQDPLTIEFASLLNDISLFGDNEFDWVENETDYQTLSETDKKRFDHGNNLLRKTIRIAAQSIKQGITPQMIDELKSIIYEQLTHEDFQDKLDV